MARSLFQQKSYILDLSVLAQTPFFLLFHILLGYIIIIGIRMSIFSIQLLVKFLNFF